MTEKHVSRHGLHLVGFSEQETKTIESFFKIAGARPPGWWVTPDPREAAILLISAPTRQAVDDCRTIVLPWHKLVIVGNSDYGSGWPTIARPIKLMVILAKINEILAGGSGPAAGATAPVPAFLAKQVPATDSAPFGAVRVQTVAPPLTANATAKVAAPLKEIQVRDTVAAPLESRQTGFVNSRSPMGEVFSPTPPKSAVQADQPAPSPAKAVSPVPIDAAKSFSAPMPSAVKPPVAPQKTSTAAQVLVVDDSDVALKFMQNRLRQYGYEGQLARSGEEALAMVAGKYYKFVFLDVMMAGLDGYQTCKAIKQNKNHHGRSPVVVMLTSRGGAIDKIRGAMAGCDAYLTKPLNERQLAAVLAKHDPAQRESGRTEAVESKPQSRFLDSVLPKR